MFEKDWKKSYLLDFYGDVLSPRKKEALDLYYNEDLSLAEIAEELNLSTRTVESYMTSALKILRIVLKDYLFLVLMLI